MVPQVAARLLYTTPAHILPPYTRAAPYIAALRSDASFQPSHELPCPYLCLLEYMARMKATRGILLFIATTYLVALHHSPFTIHHCGGVCSTWGSSTHHHNHPHHYLAREHGRGAHNPRRFINICLSLMHPETQDNASGFRWQCEEVWSKY